MKDIEIAVNAWYKDWLIVNGAYDIDFMDVLEEKFPDLKFIWTGKEYLLIN